ncbi:MAG: hypothetical protein JJT94_07735 [Bernardetiaceae bacterium]|nr:hypothetical protein [Bernardetiaceae bacterium]
MDLSYELIKEECTDNYHVQTFFSEKYQVGIFVLQGKIQDFEFYKKIWQELLNFFEQKKAYKLIIDTTKLIHSPAKGRAWFVAFYAKQVYQTLGTPEVVLVKSQNKMQAIITNAAVKGVQALGINVKIHIKKTRNEAEKLFLY